MSEKYSVLFVCLGNICRSPSAEAVFRDSVQRAGLESYITIDSAGIEGYHAGDGADRRMKQHAIGRGYQLTSISRPIERTDFSRFNLIIGMDNQNMKDLHRKAPDHSSAEIRKMTDFCTRYRDTEVPDPYYGGASGFEHVLDLLEDACVGLLTYIRGKIGQ